MSVLDLAASLTEDEMTELVEGIFTGRVGREREERLRGLIEDAPPTLREDAVAENPAVADLEEVLGLMPSEPPPEDVGAEPAIRERTQAEREARQRILDLIEGNMDDAEALAALARALEIVNANESPLVSQERLETLNPSDRADLANMARQAALRAQPLDVEDFPDLARALRRRGGRDAGYFENVIDELQGDRDLDTLARQGVDAETLENLREFHPDVLEEAIDRAREAIRGLEEPERTGPSFPVDTGARAPGDLADRAISARVRQIVPDTRTRVDPVSGEEFRADPGLERSFLEWVIGVKGSPDRFDRHYFESSPGRRRREFIAMGSWAYLQVKAGNATVESATDAGLPEAWFSGLG